MAKEKGVIICVDKKYFENVFEPGRKALQQKFKLANFSQKNYTAYLAKRKLRL
jgi:hypothetical protein